MEMAELAFEVIIADVDETNPPGMPGEEVPEHLSKKKADAVRHLVNDAIVIAADTIVLLDHHILGKPTDEAHAAAILRQLSGRMHKVVTGVCIRKGSQEKCFSVTTEVYFRPLTDEQIQYYISHYKP